jgi:hypothetical protein
MEIALATLGLGSLYILSNKDDSEEGNSSNKLRENYSNMGKNQNQLPNVEKIPINYPVKNSKEVQSNLNYYSNANAATDKYVDEVKFAQNIKKGLDNSTIAQISSLSGNQMKTDDFKHNNMVPFFGAKLPRQPEFSNNSVLDNMQGSGTEFISKSEQAPLFKPEENMHWAHGAPNMTEFYESRVNPGMKMSNIKPWEEEKVGPGLNKGFSANGSNGFNSGMEARDTWLPYNVDQLRTKNNPKVTYGLGGHEGPAINKVTNLGIEGKVEKYLPDTYYINGPDRYFTTTGLEKAQTSRPVEIDRYTNRAEAKQEYFGTGGDKPSGSVNQAPRNYQASTRNQLGPVPTSHSHARGQNSANENDYGKLGHSVNTNNRATTKHEVNSGGVSGLFKAAIAPFMDILRTTRKENVIGNLRPTGDISMPVSNGYVINPADRTKTTTKETTQYAPMDYSNIARNKDTGYTVNPQQAMFNQRDTTTDYQYMGNSGNTNATSNAQTYDAAYNAHTNATKEKINIARTNVGNTSQLNNNVNVAINKVDNDRNNNRSYFPSNAPLNIPSMETYGQYNSQPSLKNQMTERIEPSILQAFKENPFTQSLHSVA